MFKFEDNIPEVYINESRDFQLLCRLADSIYSAVKYEVDSLRHTANTKEINNKLLPLLKSKVGFFSEDSLTEEQLRYLLQGFPEIIKNKGSKKAIKEALYMWFRLHKTNARIVRLEIDNEQKSISLDVAMMPKDTALMDELFKYILPTGYIVNYQFGFPVDADEVIPFTHTLNGLIVDDYYNSKVRKFKDAEYYGLYKDDDTIKSESVEIASRVLGKLINARVSEELPIRDGLPKTIRTQNDKIERTYIDIVDSNPDPISSNSSENN